VAAQAVSLWAEAQAEQTQKSQDKLTGKKDKKSGNQISDALSALAVYDSGRSTANNKNISGKILNIIG